MKSIKLSEETHHRLKVLAAINRQDISDLGERFIREGLAALDENREEKKSEEKHGANR